MLKWGISLVAFASLLLAGVTVNAVTFNSDNFTVNGVIGNSFGGDTTSSSYKLSSTGGESIIGNGASGSYKLGEGYTAQLEKSLQLTVQPTSLGVYLPFDEPSGSVAFDQTANGNNGTVLNDPPRMTGKVNTALNFTATTQGILAPSTPSSRPSDVLTLEAWIYPTSLSTSTRTQTIISTKETGGYVLSIIGASPDPCESLKICFAVYAGGSFKFASADKSLLTNNQWQHLAGTYDGTTMKLYLNGAQISSASVTGAITYTAAAPLCIGLESVGVTCNGNSYVGAVDEVKLFNRVLSDKEVEAEYAAQNVGVPTGLTFGNQTAGVSKSIDFRSVVETDSSGYNLLVSQNQDLSSGSDSITSASGTIATPVTWNEGTTKGLGFSLFGTNATAIPGKWNSGSAYAGLPSSATSFYTRVGKATGKDTIDGRLRLDISGAQAIGVYKNTMTITGTMTP